MAGLPAFNCHLQGVARDEQSGQQGEVGHRAGAVLGVDPALNGLSFIRVSISSSDWLPHQLSGDWTKELIRNARTH